MELKKIASFQVDHTTLDRGMYTSRVDGDVVTYDIRFKCPNKGDYFTTGAAHTLEHLFATFARSGEDSDRVIYVGPMGCRTGFYLLCRDMDSARAIALTQEALAFIADYDGPIPGATEVECGNYLDQDLPGARAEAAEMARVLDGWTPEKLSY
ncbi:S-ribosylhomocysteine lyase [Slackia exigua]|uniref:S-ribosylhomocysteine lyase n=1 Tax=Slackia exigua TaxID=84109 RepID=UPI0028D58BF9|nr:S-ribosylhomocysteine lyase [Slackia exigua]